MNISKISIYPINSESKVKANGSISFDDLLVIKFTIIDTANGLMVMYPSHKYQDKDGTDKWSNDVYIIDKDTRDDIANEILSEYSKVATAPVEDNKKKSKITRTK